tara:strand:- start:5862 stop:6110 length:249 start_codon:yes stop_codon:yes gene_type:complete
MDILPRFGNVTGNREEKCTAYSKAPRISSVLVERAVPWINQSKNREKARERLYVSVCTLLTRNGDIFRSTEVEGHEEKSEVC